MSKTELILEALFTGADKAEVARRDLEAPKILLQDWIEEFLKREDVHKNPDDSYNVDGSVYLNKLTLQKLPVKFNKVCGNFWCSFTRLTSLKGAPKTVGGDFWCSNNYQLTSLEGAPKKVVGYFWCSKNAKKFTKEDVKAVCDVKGDIRV